MPSTEQPRASDRSERCRWLRSVRGRRLALGVSIGLIALVCISSWWLRRSEELPDIGDPFDVAEALRPVDLPDDQNAYAVYATAPRSRLQLREALPNVDFQDFNTLTWSKAGPEVRAVLEQRRPALEKWREGSERPDALEFQPEQLVRSGWIVSPLTEGMWDLAKLAALEGSRLEESCEMSQAWDWYRAMLRFSRLVERHGGVPAIGMRVHEEATSRILHWAADPRVDARLLRRALEDTLAADALTPPPSEILKFHYLGHRLGDWEQFLLDFGRPVPPLPGGEHGPLDQMTSLVGVRMPARMAWLRASNDVERSRRTVRLLFANWLAQVDRPAAQRAPPPRSRIRSGSTPTTRTLRPPPAPWLPSVWRSRSNAMPLSGRSSFSIAPRVPGSSRGFGKEMAGWPASAGAARS